MFSRLRLRLTALYLLAALAVIGLLGGGTYRLTSTYLQNTTDLALQHKMAHEFQERRLALPPELAIADISWNANRTRLLPRVPTSADQQARPSLIPADDHPDDEEAYDGMLAGIFVLPIGMDGQVAGPQSSGVPFLPDQQAVAGARSQAYDWRTVALPSGTEIRLLTYHVPAGHDLAAIQLGRSLTDQHRLVEQLLLVVLGLGALSAVFVGLGSWWVAGQSLRPAYQAWEHQLTFISNASHELRTPLTLLRAGTEIVLRELPAEDTDHRELLRDVVAECDHMSHLVDDLLLLSRLDARQLPLEQTIIDAPELLTDVARQVGRMATERDVRLVVTCTSGTIWADRTRLRQVLLILLDNALRHTPATGTITLEAYAHGKQIEIRVTDTGAGIAPEHLPRLWERFYRPDPARTDGGSGLGLSIAKALIAAHHGVITMTSTLGQGTQVRIMLPAVDRRSAARHQQTGLQHQKRDGRRID